MAQRPHKVSPETARKLQMLHVARTLPTDEGIAACTAHVDLFGRLATSLRPAPEDRNTAAAICETCPLLKICPVAVTNPGG
ncbi:hypothetical protein ACFV42_23105 [Streptomyces solisilvae]|uniref:hypothetical protein n=1 Tax=Streptomyces malaysiensis TaxID=92644 RepID=UPI0036C05903